MKTTKEFRKRMIIALVIFICSVALMGLIYMANNKPYVYINPGIVTSIVPQATPTIETVRINRTLKPYLPSHAANYSRPMHRTFGVTLPTQPMRGMYETSKASTQSVGGGGNGICATSTGSRGKSTNRGIQYTNGTNNSVAMPVTTFTAMASTRQVAQPAAQQAPQMARMAAAPRFAPGPPPPPNPGGGELPGDHQLVEQPIGDGLWILMLMAVGYMIAKQMTRRKAGHLL